MNSQGGDDNENDKVDHQDCVGGVNGTWVGAKCHVCYGW